MFKSPFSFDGRIRRMEYGITFIIYIVVYLVIMALSATGEGAGAIISLLLIVPMVWFLWAQGAKRCHDVGRSGWWQLIPFYFFVLLFQDGDGGRNEYGTNPKEPEQVDILESETLDGHLKN
jgi:uncharacterized membrane protein YhaH (DUF805 family)